LSTSSLSLIRGDVFTSANYTINQQISLTTNPCHTLPYPWGGQTRATENASIENASANFNTNFNAGMENVGTDKGKKVNLQHSEMMQKEVNVFAV